MRLKLEYWDNFTPSLEIIHLFSSDNSYVCVMLVIYCHNLQSFWPLSTQGEQGTLPLCLLWPHHRGAIPKSTCYMRIQSHEYNKKKTRQPVKVCSSRLQHKSYASFFIDFFKGCWRTYLKQTEKYANHHIYLERLWPPLLKLKFGNGWLTSYCCKKFNSSFQFQFQFQFQGFQFQFHFQFHQFQFQYWNWNWASIPIPELNWPQPCWYFMVSRMIFCYIIVTFLPNTGCKYRFSISFGVCHFDTLDRYRVVSIPGSDRVMICSPIGFKLGSPNLD